LRQFLRFLKCQEQLMTNMPVVNIAFQGF